MEIIDTDFEGLYLLETKVFQDNRGEFIKPFSKDIFLENGLDCDFKEFYFSINKKDVIRGMHFQSPPSEHVKVVYVSNGSILDVVLDIRKGSPNYGKCFSVELNAKNGKYLYIPKGFAHGFKSLEDGSIVNYAQTSCYNKDNDCGLAIDKINFNWEIDNPIRSGRDLTFPSLNDFESPFSF